MDSANAVAATRTSQSISVARFPPGSPFECLSNSRIPVRVCRKGAWICTQGDVLECLYIVQQGMVLLSRLSANGQETVLGFIKPGDFFGEVPLLTGTTARFNALAIQPTVLLEVRSAEFMALLEDSEACQAFVRVLAHRCSDAWTQIEALGCGPIEERLRVILSWLCLKVGVKTHEGIRVNVTQSQLAQMVGTTRESLNRQVGVLKNEGILQVPRESRRSSLLVLSLERLSQTSHFL